MRLRSVIFGVYVVSSAVGFAFLMGLMLWEVRPRYMESTRRTMAETAKLLAVMLEAKLEALPEEGGSARVADTCRVELQSLQQASGLMRVYVTDQKGIVIGDSAGGADLGKDYTRRAEMAAYFDSYESKGSSTDLVAGELRVSAPIQYKGQVVAVVGVGRQLSSVQQYIRTARIRLSIEALSIAALMVLLGWWIASRVSSSIEKLTAYVREARTQPSARPPESMALEISELGRTFEDLRQALEGKQYVEQYTQTLAHEIKAPLSAIRGAAELLAENPPEEDRARFLANLRNESERLRQVVDRLLQLASVEARHGRHESESVELEPLLRELIDGVRSAGQAAGKHLELSVQPGLRVVGERFLLRQAIDNLLQNALEFSPAAGVVRVEASREDGWLCLCVEDQGAGIPEYALPRVFERFYSLARPSTGRKSTGLGLSFVREVALLHKGSVSLVNRPEGGARAEMRLPLA
jgi:two-component system sensor histidine kinase CreC